MEPVTVFEGETSTFVIPEALFNDPDLPDDELTVTHRCTPSCEGWLTLTGLVFQAQPAINDVGTYTVTLEAADRENLMASTTFELTVEKLNDPPIFVSPTPTTDIEFEIGYSDVTWSANVTDADGDAVTVSASGLPTGATFNPQTLQFIYPRDAQRVGSYSVLLEASDGEATTPYRVTLNALPITDSDGDGLSDQTEIDYMLDPFDRDSDGDTIDDFTEFHFDGRRASDVDGDNVLDALDDDSDGDGWFDAEEAGDDDLSSPPVDTDDDGIADFRDTDSDGDGIDDDVDPCPRRLNIDGDCPPDGSGGNAGNGGAGGEAGTGGMGGDAGTGGMGGEAGAGGAGGEAGAGGAGGEAGAGGTGGEAGAGGIGGEAGAGGIGGEAGFTPIDDAGLSSDMGQTSDGGMYPSHRRW